MTVLISGVTGFVGKNLLPYLNNAGIDTISLNVRDTRVIPAGMQCEAFIHLAGIAHDTRNSLNADEYYAINYRLTKELFDSFLVSDVKKFIFISSVKAAADRVDKPLSEDFIANPQTDYGKSKLLAEQYIQSVKLPEGKSFFILRPCMIHGPGNKGNLNSLYKIVSRSIPWPLGIFENQRSFLSVENLCFVIKELLERTDVESGVYHISDDKTISTNELISIISSEIGTKSRIYKIPERVINLAARLGDIFNLPLNTEKLAKLTESYIVSNKKISRALNKSLPVEADKGIRKTVRSFYNQNLS